MSDNMPDFDKMSQEEIMAWMETLAKRQGASEGFTTDANMDIAEVDPSTAIIDEPGYVPYGQERTQPVQTAPPPPPSIPEPIKPPAAQTPPAAPPRPVTPLPSAPPSQPQAVRPPATQQTPPAAPPRPMTPPPSAPPSQPQTVRPPATQPTPPAAPPRPVTPLPSAPPSQPQTVRPPATQQTPPAAPPRPMTPPPSAPPSQPQTVRPPATQPTPPAAPPRPVTPPLPVAQIPMPPSAPPSTPKSEHGSLAWLESLAADQGDDLFNLDLSDLPADTVEAPAAPATNPMTWLEDLARSQVAEPSLERLGAEDDEEPSEKLDPFAEGVNPMEWLETLAKRQGAKEEELTTGASLNVPATQEAEVEQDGYQPFSFDTPPTRRAPEPAALENPADFLTSLAGSEGYSEEGVRAPQQPDAMSLESIQDAIANGTVSREQMQHFLEHQADELAQQPEIPYTEDEESEPIIQGELPDWLADLRPESPPPSAPEPTRPLDALFDTPATSEMPSWLTQDLIGADTSDLDSIFAPEDEEESRPLQPVAQDASLAYEIEVDTNDPWVEAFDEEYAQGGAADIQVVPDWYKQNTTDPARLAAVEGQTTIDENVEALEDAALPAENSLSLGQPQAIPEWAGGAAAQVEAQEQPVVVSGSVFDGEMPDWLKEVEESVTPEDVPDWLVETISTQDETLPRPILYSEPVQQVVVEPPTPAAPPQPVEKPVAPKLVQTLIGDVAAIIERARDREQSGDLEGALSEYETMIRTNSGLEAVVNELSQLVKSYKTTPAVYRVLGDGLMRQGKLQAALNTYREALNQL